MGALGEGGTSRMSITIRIHHLGIRMLVNTVLLIETRLAASQRYHHKLCS